MKEMFRDSSAEYVYTIGVAADTVVRLFNTMLTD